jgi:hypothetical protein
MCIVSYQIRYTKYILKDLFDISVGFVWTEKSFQFGLFFQLFLLQVSFTVQYSTKSLQNSHISWQ